jgi:pantoate--beta-alanine ligase
MFTLHTISDCRAWRNKQTKTIGFVPTMGALHDGHLSLIQESKNRCSKTIVSIYINPTQFSNNEDLSSYPKTIESDFKNLKKLNVDAVFLPTDSEIYPENKQNTFKYENKLFKKLEGASRPHFFYGVTHVVSRLFDIVCPSHAFFGDKDAQQSLVVQKMILDLKYNIKLKSCPIIRHQSGLALSSRNNYLTLKEKNNAGIIYHSLMLIKENISSGEKNTKKLKNIFTTSIQTCAGFEVDYISIASKTSLKELTTWQPNSLISTAVFYKQVRLIDNLIY